MPIVQIIVLDFCQLSQTFVIVTTNSQNVSQHLRNRANEYLTLMLQKMSSDKGRKQKCWLPTLFFGKKVFFEITEIAQPMKYSWAKWARYFFCQRGNLVLVLVFAQIWFWFTNTSLNKSIANTNHDGEIRTEENREKTNKSGKREFEQIWKCVMAVKLVVHRYKPERDFEKKAKSQTTVHTQFIRIFGLFP